MDTPRKYLHEFMTIPHSVLQRTRDISDKSYRDQNQNTHFMFNNFFPPENRAVSEENVEKIWYSRAEHK
jgi:hypothetical protein